jgi:hypothetical protein
MWTTNTCCPLAKSNKTTLLAFFLERASFAWEPNRYERVGATRIVCGFRSNKALVRSWAVPPK